MKILFVLNQLPFPPRNGVTIPSYNFLTGLSGAHEVSLLFLRDNLLSASDEDIKSNSLLVDSLWVMDVAKQPKFERIANELKGSSIYHIGRIYNEKLVKDICAELNFDLIWVSDDGLLDVLPVFRKYSTKRFKAVAGLNDCITAVFKQSRTQMLLKGGNLKQRLLMFVKWLRSFRVHLGEISILKDYDFILVQSEADKSHLKKLSAIDFKDNVFVISNGVERKLFSTEYNLYSEELVFVGSLRGYSRIVVWLLEEVWPVVINECPNAIFHIIGKGATKELIDLIAETSNVIHTEYVENIADVYKDKGVSVSPVFKTYGLINKVIESMASGVPVVADIGSFNCIANFEDKKHAMVANDAKAMSEAICLLLNSKSLREKISADGRELIRKNFDWKQRITSIEQIIQSS